MATLTFDTHEFVKKLKGVGFSEEQAEILTELQKTTVLNTLEQLQRDYKLNNLATRRDLKEFKSVLRQDIEIFCSHTERDIERSKAELIRWIVGMGLLQTTIIAGLFFRLAGKI